MHGLNSYFKKLREKKLREKTKQFRVIGPVLVGVQGTVEAKRSI